jgi:hypothetical protein
MLVAGFYAADSRGGIRVDGPLYLLEGVSQKYMGWFTRDNDCL